MRRPVRWLLGVLIAVLLLAGLGYWNAHRVADTILEAGRLEFRAEVARLRARNFGRPPLLDPVQPGDASEVYAEVFNSLMASRHAQFLYRHDQDPPTPADLVRTSAAAARLTPVILRLEAAFHHAYTVGPPAGFGSTAGAVPSIMCQVVGAYVDRALTCAKISVREGRVAEALRLLTAAWLVAADAARGGTFADITQSRQHTTAAREALCDILATQPLAAHVLKEFAGRLDALVQERYRTSDSWTIERCNLMGTLAEDRIWGGGDRRIIGLPAKLENLWSIRIARAHVLRCLPTLPTALESEGSDPWRAELEPALERMRQDIPRVAHAALRFRWESPFFAEQRAVAANAAVRLAIAVARFEAERGAWPVAEHDLVPSYLPEIPTSPFDPTGLRFSGNRIWSRDTNGIDEGGQRPSDVLGYNGDFVLEVKGRR